MSYSPNLKAAKDFLRWLSSRPVFEPRFISQQGFSTPATRNRLMHPLWTADPVMTPFRDVILTARAPGWPGPSGRNAAEVVSKYIATDMYAKALQGMSAEEAVRWAEGELKKIYV
jgi:multiple sugar transport system substrate-binding protein